MTAELLAAIYAAPDDLEPRRVYADWLQQQGDPRGEFIALQLARLEARGTAKLFARELELLSLHRSAWLGSLDAHVYRDGAVFEAGFAAYVEPRVAPATAELRADPAYPLLLGLLGTSLIGGAMVRYLREPPPVVRLKLDDDAARWVERISRNDATHAIELVRDRWWIRLTREPGAGPYTRLVAFCARELGPRESAGQLEKVLDAIPPGLRDVRIELASEVVLRETTRLDAKLARHPLERVPWDSALSAS